MAGKASNKRPDPEILSAERDGNSIIVTVCWNVVVPVADLQEDAGGKHRPKPKGDRLKAITGRLDAGEVRKGGN